MPHPNPLIAAPWSRAITHSSSISIPNPGESDGTTYPSFGKIERLLNIY